MAATSRPSGFLPRLGDEAYRGPAVVFWTHTVDQRATGWLDERFHTAFREICLHTAVRENLFCPVYTLMPDHVHFIWMGVSSSSDQRPAARFLRTFLGKELKPFSWQHQPHDRVLREEERRQKAFMAMVDYIAMNPVRAGLAVAPEDWRYTGCIIPGYPDLHPLKAGFWEKFWSLHEAAIVAGSVGKLEMSGMHPAV